MSEDNNFLSLLSLGVFLAVFFFSFIRIIISETKPNPSRKEVRDGVYRGARNGDDASLSL